MNGLLEQAGEDPVEVGDRSHAGAIESAQQILDAGDGNADVVVLAELIRPGGRDRSDAVLARVPASRPDPDEGPGWAADDYLQSPAIAYEDFLSHSIYVQARPYPGVRGVTVEYEHEQALRVGRDRLQARFNGVVSPETIERLLEESVAGFADAKVTSWIPVLAERFTADRLRALERTEMRPLSDKPCVLFLCVHNAGRSQMAAAWASHLAGDSVEVFSGGSMPTDEVNAAAIEAMHEVGVDMTAAYPKPWADELVEAADVIITMGCGDACPVIPGKRYEDWQVPDPAGRGVEAVRPIRDELRERVVTLLASLDVAATA